MLQLIKKKKYIFGAVIAVLIIGGYYWYSQSKLTSTAVQYKTAVAEKGTLMSSISASGNVIVDDDATVDPTITGTVYGLAVSVGDKVKKGQLLFLIENNQLGIDANKAYSSYLQSKASLETAKANKNEAKNNYEDANDSEEYAMKKKLEAAEISLEAAEKNVETSWSSYQNSLSDASKRKVVSPIDGTVNAVNIKNGDDLSRLSSNSNSSAPIIIGDLSTLKAQVEVNEVDIANVNIGQKVSLTFSAIDGLIVTGKVEKMDSLGTLTSGVVTYNVTIGFDSLDSRVRPEMSVSAAIIIGTKQDAIIVPNSAVKSQNGKSYVQILKGQTPENITVEVGLSNDTQTEIVSGIKVGDSVVTQTINSSSASTASSTSNSKNSVRIPGMGGGHID
ncbi:MAG TPA: efflux RND transporter periplasmic adaptor subunit [Candidatus Moranbacteria bacterium]|nr:efflux RND transporter periplasmic adaptor subunit [Candidatus Moranbacteria bacterium]HRY27961.1 efflux RND transporter periplasmic adaptor subunit [Candidatus Moranbacteria bacterium]HSA08223.1 efflux RND transporter periplasmic adaptor subunit [Candidatus Moranbacteria bacterium]